MIPIFIGGCGRSGTTLLGSLLGSHSKCVAVPESHFLIRGFRVCGAGGDRQLVAEAARRILGDWEFKNWGFPPDASFRSECRRCDSYAELIERLARRYAAAVDRPEATFWVDHTPTHTMYARALAELFPEAKWIHILRDGRAVAASVIPLDWGPNSIIEAARWWVASVGYNLAAEAFLGPERIVRVKYEDLVDRPQQTLRGLCGHVGLDYEPSMVRGDGFRVPPFTTAQHALVGGAPDKSRIDAWTTRLSPRQIELFESETGDFLHYLGYCLRCGWRSETPSWLEKAAAAISEQSRRLVNRIRFHRRVRRHAA